MSANSAVGATTDVAAAGVVSPAAARDLPVAQVLNPADTSAVVGHYVLSDAATVDAVVAHAETAGRAWGALSGTERGSWLTAAAKAVSAHEAERSTLLTREQGKVLWESEVDVHSAARALRQNAELAAHLDVESVVRDGRGTTIMRRIPMGLTAVIVPWNYPVYLTLAGVAPALAAGNAVIVKPSEFAPLAITRTLELIAAALPEGVLSVVPGDGAVAGQALVSHPLVRKVIFTGGTSTGRSIVKTAANTLKSVSLELGGNDPAIVLDSAQLDDRTIRELRRSVFTCTGQICINVKRIYVHRSRHREFVDKFSAAVDEIVVGDGLGPATTMGPLNNAKQLASVRELAEQTRSHADVRVLGRKNDPSSWDRGYFMLPSVVTGIAPGAPLVTREQFGPIIPILPFDTEDEAISQANDSEFGLAASVWSEDVDHALALARRVEAGSVFVNTHRMGSSDQSMPFGGIKQSGLGRNHGMWAIEECTELQAISHRPDTSGFPGPPTV
ncbi:aldehyde dehydrogenase family protein [Streptomyces thinghirensis]|uniref:Aldehyde dehydrogenase family protein n=1 Tax=Streptomyces thinghirensis TaxID=551547 RepID=A0ABP9T8L1_9ACTN